jgi:hypothetical protein
LIRAAPSLSGAKKNPGQGEGPRAVLLQSTKHTNRPFCSITITGGITAEPPDETAEPGGTRRKSPKAVVNVANSPDSKRRTCSHCHTIPPLVLRRAWRRAFAEKTSKKDTNRKSLLNCKATWLYYSYLHKVACIEVKSVLIRDHMASQNDDITLIHYVLIPTQQEIKSRSKRHIKRLSSPINRSIVSRITDDGQALQINHI